MQNRRRADPPLDHPFAQLLRHLAHNNRRSRVERRSTHPVLRRSSPSNPSKNNPAETATRLCVNNPPIRPFTSLNEDVQSSSVVSIDAPITTASYHGDLLIRSSLYYATVMLNGRLQRHCRLDPCPPFGRSPPAFIATVTQCPTIENYGTLEAAADTRAMRFFSTVSRPPMTVPVETTTVLEPF